MKLFRVVKINAYLIFLAAIVLVFFYKTIFFGLIPFPGDLLVAHQEPYKSNSYLGFLPGGVPHKAQGSDVIKQLIPWKHFSVESLARGEIPFWNPYNFSGNPHLANFQSAVFYPGNLIFFALDFKTAWSILIIASPLLSALFMYVFLKRLNLSPPASVLGGLSFAFSLYMVVWMEYGNIGHTLMFLPLTLYFADRLLAKVNYRYFLGLTLTYFLAILAGYIQGIFYMLIVTFIYFISKGYFEKKLSGLKLGIFFLALIFPILLTSFQLIPTLEVFSSSTRGSYSVDQIQNLLNPLWYLITVIAPDFFGNPASRNYWFDGTYIERVSYFGLIPFAFALFAILTRKGSEIKIFKFFFFATLILSVDLVFTKLLYLLPIPVISTTVPTRLLSIFAFSGAVLAAFGFDLFLQKKEKRTLFISLGIIFSILLLSLAFVIIYPRIVQQIQVAANFNVSLRNLFIPFVTVAALGIISYFHYSKLEIFKHAKKQLIIFSIVAFTAFELFFYFQKITPFAPKEFFYPETPVVSFLKENAGVNRSWGYGSAYIESNIQTFDRIFTTDGNDPLHIKEYTELLESSKNGRVPDFLPRPDANVAPGFGKEDLKLNTFRQNVLNLTGVKYILNKDETINGSHNPDYQTFPEEKYKLVWQEGLWQVYENLEQVPRLLVTNQYRVAESPSQAIRILHSKDFDGKKEIVLYENPNIESSSEIVYDTEITSYSPTKEVREVETDKRALLYLSDTYYKDWKAYVNGVGIEILKANYAFRAIPIESGTHEVIFNYVPTGFYRGVYIALASMLALILVTCVIYKKYGDS